MNINKTMSLQFAICDFIGSDEPIIYINLNDKIWFKAKNIVSILEYKNTNKAINDHVDNDNKNTLENIINDTLKFNQNNLKTKNKVLTNRYHPKFNQNDLKTIYINRYGVYDLMLNSKKKQAKQFKNWVFNLIDKELKNIINKKEQEEINTLKNQQKETTIKRINLSISTLKMIDSFDERDRVYYADIIRNIENDNKAIEHNNIDREISISLRLNEKYPNLKYGSSKLRRLIPYSIGRLTAKEYRIRYNKEPEKRTQYVDGTNRKINCYRESHYIEFIDSIISNVIHCNELEY